MTLVFYSILKVLFLREKFVKYNDPRYSTRKTDTDEVPDLIIFFPSLFTIHVSKSRYQYSRYKIPLLMFFYLWIQKRFFIADAFIYWCFSLMDTDKILYSRCIYILMFFTYGYRKDSLQQMHLYTDVFHLWIQKRFFTADAFIYWCFSLMSTEKILYSRCIYILMFFTYEYRKDSLQQMHLYTDVFHLFFIADAFIYWCFLLMNTEKILYSRCIYILMLFTYEYRKDSL